jgi:hypothetical protein
MRHKFVEKSYCKKNPQSAIFLHKTYLFPPLPFFNFYFSNKSTKKIEKNTNNDKELGTIFKKVCGSASKTQFSLYELILKVA